MKLYPQIVKPVADRIMAAILLVLLSPLWVCILVALLINNRGKPFFTQVRPGFKGKPFRVIKFKTMTDRCDAEGSLLPDEDRTTWLGRMLRRTSLDEIPQLLNVIAGQLSFVGPRPLLMEYLPLYNQEQARRHDVIPGITGLAQINGRNHLDWEKRFAYDVYYVDNQSFWLDLKIALLTIPRALSQQGIDAQVHSSEAKFTGSDENRRHSVESGATS